MSKFRTLVALLATGVLACSGGESQEAAATGVDLTVTPPAIETPPGGSVVFAAAVTGSANTTVTWSVEERGGTIDAAGRYVAPQNEGTYQVVARSVADPGVAAFATVRVSASTGGWSAAQARYESDRNACRAEPLRSTGTIYYYCDCQPGADVNCVPGDDANAGTSPSAPRRTFDNARALLNDDSVLRAGDTVALCRGGSFRTGTSSPSIANLNCTAENTCDFRDYVPSWSNSGARPIVTMTASEHMFYISDGGSTSERDGGYRFLNVEYRGSGSGGNGMYVLNDVDDLEVCGNVFRDFAIGISFSRSQECTAGNAGCNGQHDRSWLHGNEFVHNRDQGVYGSSNGGALEYNHFSRNGWGATPLLHQIYAGTSSIAYLDGRIDLVPITGFAIRGNVLRNSVPDASGACQGMPLIANGAHNGLVIEDNDVEGSPSAGLAAATGYCWGLGIGSGNASGDRNPPEGDGHQRVIIRRNRIYNVGNRGINVTACVDCTIENNVVHMPRGANGIVLDDSADPYDAVTTNAIVKNNTLSFTDVGSGSVGIQAYSNRSGGSSEPRGFTIASNVIHFASGQTSTLCFSYPQLGTASSSYSVTDNNLCHGGTNWAFWGTTRGSISEFRAAFPGRDVMSLTLDPMFADAERLDFSLQAGSPAVGLAHPTIYASDDSTGTVRDGAPDAGATEQ